MASMHALANTTLRCCWPTLLTIADQHYHVLLSCPHPAVMVPIHPQEWLTSVKIKYYESKLNLAWKPILKHIMADPQAFIDDVSPDSHLSLSARPVCKLAMEQDAGSGVAYLV
jgi:hypothetical protein